MILERFDILRDALVAEGTNRTYCKQTCITEISYKQDCDANEVIKERSSNKWHLKPFRNRCLLHNLKSQRSEKLEMREREERLAGYYRISAQQLLLLDKLTIVLRKDMKVIKIQAKL